MFVLLQAAKQLPPINVTVQTPPGMPEWEKTLLAAGTGALFGIMSNIAMEYVKPWIGKKQLRKTITRQLSDELIGNLNQMEGIVALLKSINLEIERERESGLDLAETIMKAVNGDRYDYFFVTQKPLVYEVDADKSLGAFYHTMAELGLRMSQRRPSAFIRSAMLATTLGKKFLERLGIPYAPKPIRLQELHNAIMEDRKAGDAKPKGS